MGGIQDGPDALDFIAAGATCVAVGTENFRDPAAGARVREELRASCNARRCAACTTHAQRRAELARRS